MNDLEKSRLKSVDDEFIGELCFDSSNNGWTFKLRDDYDSKFIPSKDVAGENVIAVILESPHKHEFESVSLTSDDNKSYNSRPLNNSKSRKALSCILKYVMISFYDKSKTYKIVLINAVKFQNSLGKNLNEDSNRDIRNQNWLKNWIEFKDDLSKRVKDVDPELIFNLCTQGAYLKSTKTFQDIDNNYLQSFGLKFKKDKNEKEFFEVKKSFGYEKFTLQEAVEYELEKKGLITNYNYTKYYHPAKFTYSDNPCYPVLDKKNKINFCQSKLIITSHIV